MKSSAKTGQESPLLTGGNVELIDLELIQDNPYQPRIVYHRQDINDLAASIQIHGLLQVPPARRKNGGVQLGFGHLRKRAFLKLAKQDPATWGKMPLDIRDLTDEQMAMFALEENLKRRDITPIEVARAVDNYLTQFSEKTEVEIARQLSMTQGNISNMRRVIKLPAKILEKVDQGRISFTQARELIILEKLENEELMLAAIRGIRSEGRPYGHANTVEGMQAAVHDVISNHCRPLDKDYKGYRWDLIFDTRAAGCLQCEKMVRTHPTKSATAHYCLDDKCWDRHQEEQREKASAEAKARMQADIIERAAREIAHSEEASVERIISVDEEKFAEISASYSAKRISEGKPLRKPFKREEKLYIAISGISMPGEEKAEAYQLVPRAEFTGEIRTYAVPKGRGHEEYYDSLRNDPMGFYHGMLVKRGKEECILVGPPINFVWHLCKKDISQEIPASCQDCFKLEECLGSPVWQNYKGNPACPNRETTTSAEEATAIPEDILSLAREKAGTRAEVLDLKDIGAGYFQEVGQGYALLDGSGRALEHVIDPKECLERCTKGFHYAFDSRRDNPRTQYVCSDPKCLAKMKVAFTRAKNAEGQGLKNAERKAVKEAIAQTTTLDRPRLKLILLAQMVGGHTTRNYYGPTEGKKPETWLWEKLSAGTPAIERKREDLFKRIDKLSDEELAKLIVEFMFYYLTDKGDIGSYEIKTAGALRWMGVEVKINETAQVKEEAGKTEHEQIQDSLPCKDCQNAPTCDRSHFYTDGEGGYVCDNKVNVDAQEVPGAV